MRSLLLLVLALCCSLSFAQTTRVEYRAKNNVYPSIMSGFHETKASAAAEMISLVNAYLPSIDVQCVNLTKNGVRKRNAAINGWTGADPAGWDVGRSVMPQQTCSTWSAETRFGGYTFQWEQRTVEVPQCSDGQTSQHTFFSGWSTDQNGTNMVGGDVPGPSSYCDGQCLSDRTSLVSCNSDGELSPNGYYSGTCTWSYTSNGQTCTTPTQDPGPTPEPPPQNPGDGDPGDGDGDPGDGDGGGDPGDGDGGTGDPDGDPDCGGEGQDACEGDGDGGSSSGGGTACTQEQIAAGLCSCTTPEGQPSQCGTGGGNTGGGNTGGGGDDGGDDGTEWGSPVPAGSSYDKKEKTFNQVLQSARSAWNSTAIGSGVSGFFTVQAGGGSCPTYTADIPYIDASVTLDVFCAPWLLSVAVYIKAALLLVAAFFAFRIAFL